MRKIKFFSKEGFKEDKIHFMEGFRVGPDVGNCIFQTKKFIVMLVYKKLNI